MVPMQRIMKYSLLLQVRLIDYLFHDFVLCDALTSGVVLSFNATVSKHQMKNPFVYLEAGNCSIRHTFSIS